MRNIWLVIKHDVAVILRQRSFWIVTILMPLFFVGIQLYGLLQDNDVAAEVTAPVAVEDVVAGDSERSEEESDEGHDDTAVAPEPAYIGLVDESGLLVEEPADLPRLFIPYGDRETAVAALSAGEVVQVAVIPSDYLATGEVIVFDENFQISPGSAEPGVAFGNSSWALQYLIDYNLVEDKSTLNLLRNPLPVPLTTYHALQPETDAPADAESPGMAMLLSWLMPYVLYFLLILGSNYMLQSVVAEKENRTVEVLLLSLPPRQLMIGKILGMTVVLLIQIMVWVGGGSLILDQSSFFFDLGSFSLPPDFLVWAVLFLVLGFLLYAALMAAAGALATNMREGGQMTWLLIIPLLPTLVVSSLFVEEPNNPLVVGLSLFPLSAPSAMVTRIAVSPVPLWQIVLSLALVALTTYGAVVMAARFFRSGNLLSSASFSWRRFVDAWR